MSNGQLSLSWIGFGCGSDGGRFIQSLIDLLWGRIVGTSFPFALGRLGK